MSYANIFIAGAVFLSCVVGGYANACQQPSPQPNVAGKHYKALQKKAAYAAFIADECGFGSDVQRKYGALVKTIFDDSVDAQQRSMEEFKSRKRRFSDETGFLTVKKNCLWNTGKTRALVNETSDDISSYMDNIAEARKKHQREIIDWNNCLDNVMLKRVSERAMKLTRNRAQNFLQAGWAAGAMLEPQRASLMENKVSSDGYIVVTRLWYLNALGTSQSLDIAFFYNKDGNETGIEFVDYSDGLAKHFLPIRQLSRRELLNRIK